jgi:mannose-6-phosphate isomerase-like protein (cupin superfamily)
MVANKTGYDLWLEQEGLPVIGGFGLQNVADVPRQPWDRLGGLGAYIRLKGMEGYTGMYVVEVPGGGALNPERHLYEEYIYVLRGRGSTQVWQEGSSTKRSFEWGEGSLFALPVNTWHRSFNAGREPALLMGVTNAPMIMDIFHNVDFVMDNDAPFTDRYSGQEDFYDGEGKRYPVRTSNVWETNLIPDARAAFMEPSRTGKIPGGHNGFCYEMAGNTLIGHVNEMPVGKCHKAHHHGGGALLLCLRSKGYSLMWPSTVGPRPYEVGRADAVERIDFAAGGIFAPPGGWFHQHFNTGHEPIRQLAFRYQGLLHPIECWPAGRDDQSLIPIREGGTMLEPRDEDPEIRQMWEAELRREGITSQMPAIEDVHA